MNVVINPKATVNESTDHLPHVLVDKHQVSAQRRVYIVEDVEAVLWITDHLPRDTLVMQHVMVSVHPTVQKVIPLPHPVRHASEQTYVRVSRDVLLQVLAVVRYDLARIAISETYPTSIGREFHFLVVPRSDVLIGSENLAVVYFHWLFRQCPNQRHYPPDESPPKEDIERTYCRWITVIPSDHCGDEIEGKEY
jgi:hypothetical protein